MRTLTTLVAAAHRGALISANALGGQGMGIATDSATGLTVQVEARLLGTTRYNVTRYTGPAGNSIGARQALAIQENR